MDKVVIIGAGAIGKGVMVPLFLGHNLNIILANRTIGKITNPLINGYYVHEMKKSTLISGYLSYGLDEDQLYEKIAQANILVISISNDAILEVFVLVSSIIEKFYRENVDRKLTILIVSNSMNAMDKLKEKLLSVVSRNWYVAHIEMLHVLVFIGAKINASSLYDIDVNSMHGYIEMEESLFTDLNLWKEIKTVKNVKHRLIIKLALVNRVQLYFALMGKQKNYNQLKECFQDNDIFNKAKASYEEACGAISHKYPNEIDNNFINCLWKRVLSGEEELLDRFLHHVELKLNINERLKIPLDIAMKEKLPYKNMMDGLLLAQRYCKKREKI